MKIDIGAGGHPAPGYVSVDLNPRFADVVASADHLPFPDGSVEAIRAIDVLEHCSYRATDAVLAEWARVCAPAADLYVQVPAAETIMEWFVHDPGRLLRGLPPELPQTPLAGATWRLCGGQDDGERVDTNDGDDWRWNAHYALFSKESLRDALYRAGFNIEWYKTNPFPNLQFEARRM